MDGPQLEEAHQVCRHDDLRRRVGELFLDRCHLLCEGLGTSSLLGGQVLLGMVFRR